MAKRLSAAQDLAERARYSGDTLKRSSEGDASHTERLRSFLYQNELQINPSVTPALADCLARVYNHLHIPSGTVEAFVFPSAEIQAECHSGSTSECVIRISSALIDILDDDEVGFVAGHELGHFLLGHGIARHEAATESLEYFMLQRSQEISVDRIGLLACGSLDVAVRALMKTASGLTSKHLRFDVGTFVAQLRSATAGASQANPTSSHPSILVRCRALLWFSLNDFFTRGESHFSVEQMAKLDKLIENDLHKFVDGPARERIEEAKRDLAMWMAVCEVVQDGVFAKHEQEVLADMFGTGLVERLKSFLSNVPAAEVHDTVYERMVTARDELEGVIPTSFEAEFEKIRERVNLRFAG